MTKYAKVPKWVMESPHTPSEECDLFEDDMNKWCDWCRKNLLEIYPLKREKYK